MGLVDTNTLKLKYCYFAAAQICLIYVPASSTNSLQVSLLQVLQAYYEYYISAANHLGA